MSDETAKAQDQKVQRAWWKDPMAIVFGIFILGACVLVMCQGWTPPLADPVGRKTPVPGGGSFCDPATPTQGTLENPSTQQKLQSK